MFPSEFSEIKSLEGEVTVLKSTPFESINFIELADISEEVSGHVELPSFSNRSMAFKL